MGGRETEGRFRMVRVQGDTAPSEIFGGRTFQQGGGADHESEFGDAPSGAVEVFGKEGSHAFGERGEERRKYYPERR